MAAQQLVHVGGVTLAKRIGHNFDGITAAVHKGLSNSPVEGLNAGIRLIQCRAHGYANPHQQAS